MKSTKAEAGVEISAKGKKKEIKFHFSLDVMKCFVSFQRARFHMHNTKLN